MNEASRDVTSCAGAPRNDQGCSADRQQIWRLQREEEGIRKLFLSFVSFKGTL